MCIRINKESHEKSQIALSFPIVLIHLTVLIALRLFHCVFLPGMRASVHVDLPGWTKEGLPALKVSHRVFVFFLTYWPQ
jgi:hypothetical protein